MTNYTSEMVADIKEREQKGLAALKELNLTPAIVMQMVNMGEDVFGIKPVPYLSDTKYTPQPSPYDIPKD